MWRHRWHQERQVSPNAPMGAQMADYGIDDKVPSRVPFVTFCRMVPHHIPLVAYHLFSPPALKRPE